MEAKSFSETRLIKEPNRGGWQVRNLVEAPQLNGGVISIDEVISRATQSVFQEQLEMGMTGPVPLKTVWRRLVRLNDEVVIDNDLDETDRKQSKLSRLQGRLSEGIAVSFEGNRFVTELELAEKLPGGRVKELSRIVGDRIRRKPPSTVIERRRQSPNWRIGEKANEFLKLQGRVMITPYEEWLDEQEKNKAVERLARRGIIKGKQLKRQLKRERRLAEVEELQQRVEGSAPPSDRAFSNVFVFQQQDMEVRQRTEGFWESVMASSIMPPERPGRIKELIYQGASGVEPPMILNWICPRGTSIAWDEETRRLYRRYTMTDPEEGFESDYQILPRIDLERGLAKRLERFSIEAAYIKAVADDNPYCLYPACLRIDGEGPTMAAIKNQSAYAQGRFDELVGKNNIWVIPWSELLGPRLFAEYLETYEKITLEQLMPYLPDDIVETEIEILTDHTQPAPDVLPQFERFASDCIRYFAVEGLFLDKVFDDNVIVAWNDSTRISRTIDALRLDKGLALLPKIYVLHEKRDGKIVDDF